MCDCVCEIALPQPAVLLLWLLQVPLHSRLLLLLQRRSSSAPLPLSLSLSFNLAYDNWPSPQLLSFFSCCSYIYLYICLCILYDIYIYVIGICPNVGFRRTLQTFGSINLVLTGCCCWLFDQCLNHVCPTVTGCSIQLLVISEFIRLAAGQWDVGVHPNAPRSSRPIDFQPCLGAPPTDHQTKSFVPGSKIRCFPDPKCGSIWWHRQP